MIKIKLPPILKKIYCGSFDFLVVPYDYERKNFQTLLSLHAYLMKEKMKKGEKALKKRSQD